GNSLVNAASSTGSVTLPWNAVDNDPSFNTYSTLSTGAQLLSNVFETVIFETPSQPGDSVKLVIQDPGGSLLNLVALKGFAIQPYLGNTPVGSPITNSGSLLSLKLLPGGANKYELSVAIPSSFDRIEILMGGVADALSGLRVYDVERVIAAPVITSNNIDVTNDTVYVYYSNSLEIDAATLNSSDNIRWYNDENAQVGSGSSYFIPSVVEEGWYYAEATRNGCTETSSTHAVYVKILSPQMLNTQTEKNRLHREIQEQVKGISIQNPATEEIRIKLWGLEKGNYRLDVISLEGRLIYSKQMPVSTDRYSESIPKPGNMRTGIYMVSIYDKSNTRIRTFKVIFK
ncbi:MAG: T9SS type A sorting domain-containing protein, partial [Chitinophagaceae bacterium]|nr:T9SS type A sorting domain-containing protein [Chitinophagaceae bacterium]